MPLPQPGIFALGTSSHAYLDAMVGLDGGPRDELTLFTRPLTGSHYFIPSADDLAQLGDGGRSA